MDPIVRDTVDDIYPEQPLDLYQPPQRSTGQKIYDAAGAILDSLTFGLGDELTAATGSLLGRDYDTELAQQRADLKLYQEQHPIESLAYSMIGGLPLGMVAAPAAAARELSLLGRAGQAAKLGLTYGGLYGYGTGEGDWYGRLGSAGENAALGAVMGPAMEVGFMGMGKGLGALNRLDEAYLAGQGKRVLPVAGAAAIAANSDEDNFTLPLAIGAVAMPTLGRGALRYLRGAAEGTPEWYAQQRSTVPWDELFLRYAKKHPEILVPEYDMMTTPEQVIAKVKAMQYMDPILDENWLAEVRPSYINRGKKAIPGYEGQIMLGNPGKTARYNATYAGNPELNIGGGRATWESYGCGRDMYCILNNLPEATRTACGKGGCFAEATIKGGVKSHLETVPQLSPEMQAIRDAWEAAGGDIPGQRLAALKQVQEQFAADDYHIKLNVGRPKSKRESWTTSDDFEWTSSDAKLIEPQKKAVLFGDQGDTKPEQVFKITARKGRPAPAKVTNKIGEYMTTGIDQRIGQDTDGAAWLTRPDVMDEIYRVQPRIVSVYASAYHKPPPPHPLADRTIINVSLWGDHSIQETLHKLQWAQQARKNGWNVVLRTISDQPELYPTQVGRAALRNRLMPLVDATDFYTMEQPFHLGPVHSEPRFWPACCQGGTCENCMNTEGVGSAFRMFWNLEEDQPFFTAFPEMIQDIDKRTVATLARNSGVAGRYGYLANALDPSQYDYLSEVPDLATYAQRRKVPQDERDLLEVLARQQRGEDPIVRQLGVENPLVQLLGIRR